VRSWNLLIGKLILRQTLNVALSCFRCLVALSQAHPSGSPAAAASEETTEGENRSYLVMQSFTGTGGGAKTVDL
jgi:hypothetical protein